MFELNFSKHIFKNGIRYIEAPVKKTGVVAVLVVIKAGSRFEAKKENGLAHFLEHMFFKGGKRYKNVKEVSEAVDRVGGMFNAATEKEEVSFFVKLPSKNIETALDILSDMLSNSVFRKEDIKQEKNVIIEEINMYEDSPMYQTSEILEEILYKNNSLGRKIIGEKKTVSSLNRRNFLNYIKRIYLPLNIVIVTAGDTSKITKEKIFRYFGIFSSRKPVKLIKPREIQEKPEIKIKFKETEQTHLSLGFHFPEATYNHKDFFDARILNIILGEGMSSRVFLEVREKKGLAYRVNSFMQSFTDTGYIEIESGVDNKKVQKAISAIIFECEKLKKKPVDKKELYKAKEYMKGKLLLSLEDSLNIAFNAGKQELLTGKILKVSEIFEKIDSVTSKNILRLANKNFKNNKLNLALIGPFKEKDSLTKVLKIS